MKEGFRRIPDPYNASKVWIVRRYPSGNYYYNQENTHIKLNTRFARTTRAFLSTILGRDVADLF